MNTNNLKKFAQQARQKLIEQVTAKLESTLSSDSAVLREQAGKVKKLQQTIATSSKETVIERVAYTWFNRFIALRFMDVNDYQPLKVRIITPPAGYILPELLNDARQHNLPNDEHFHVDAQRIYDLLDGKIPSPNAQNEVFRALLVAACNHLHSTFPFLFERINDYTELLLPDDLLSEFSIVHDVREGMDKDDCKEVEVIGWLYQFYISERKDEVFASKTKVAKEDIPAATQLFTPRWIVEYMVQNTVGKLWLQNKPNSKLRDHMPYYIESATTDSEDYLKVNSVEDLTLLDQACGSGHILVYGFDLLYKIYQEEGYSNSDIPQLILEKNLHGFEIDERAAQLASFALMMKAREQYKRIFRKQIVPNILRFENLVMQTYIPRESDEITTVNKTDKDVKNLFTYNYQIAEDVIEVYFVEVKDKKTGKVKSIRKTRTLVKKGDELHEWQIPMIFHLLKEKIPIYNDEIRDTFKALRFPFAKGLHKDLKLMRHATNFGSLIQATATYEDTKAAFNKFSEVEKNTTDIYLLARIQKIKEALSQLLPLTKKYHCVVDNPPYMGGGNMNKPLSTFVKKNYKDSKADLMACFMEAGLAALHPKGYLGMINQHSWMFLSSYVKLREKLIQTIQFDTLLHLGPRTFPEIGGEVVQNVAFTFIKSKYYFPSIYLRLVDIKDAELKREKTLITLNNKNNSRFFSIYQNKFKSINQSPIGYWLSNEYFEIFNSIKPIKESGDPKVGIQTGDNEKFLRIWSEIEEKKKKRKWYNYDKGGEGRKWFGNKSLVVNWEFNGKEIRRHKKSVLRNQSYYFRKSIQWSRISSGRISARYTNGNSLFDINSASLFFDEEKLIKQCLAYLNSKISLNLLTVLAPTLTFQVGDIARLPFQETSISEFKIKNCIQISKTEWNSRETSWDFQKNELLTHRGQDLEESYELYGAFWRKKFFELHANEEELNRQFIDIYGLQDELTPDVPLQDITILKAEADIVAGDLVFNKKEIIQQLISYAVGCLFGRYSLDKDGLILANAGETLEDYLQKIDKTEATARLLPDDDNIIPILQDEWFSDDITGRFKEFLKTAFGAADYQKNLAFVEEALGKPLRKYFIKDFYNDHIKRYKKRPIYWLFASPSGAFSALIYLHRYTPDTLNLMLTNYLEELREKLRLRVIALDGIKATGTPKEQVQADKEQDALKKQLVELQEYERHVLRPFANDRIAIDLDDGVLVNYNKFGKAIKEVRGLNDAKTKKKVKGFDWIDGEAIV